MLISNREALCIRNGQFLRSVLTGMWRCRMDIPRWGRNVQQRGWRCAFRCLFQPSNVALGVECQPKPVIHQGNEVMGIPNSNLCSSRFRQDPAMSVPSAKINKTIATAKT